MKTTNSGQESGAERLSAPLAGCAQHREEMTLLALKRKLAAAESVSEQDRLRAEIAHLEALLGLD